MRIQRFFRTDAAALFRRGWVHRNQRPPRCCRMSNDAKVTGRMGEGTAYGFGGLLRCHVAATIGMTRSRGRGSWLFLMLKLNICMGQQFSDLPWTSSEKRLPLSHIFFKAVNRDISSGRSRGCCSPNPTLSGLRDFQSHAGR